MKTVRFYTEIEYITDGHKWIDNLIVKTDDINKVYTYCHNRYSNIISIRAYAESEFEVVELKKLGY